MWTRCKYGPCHWLCCPSPVPLARFHKISFNISQIYISQGSRGSEKVSPSQSIISQASRGSEKVLTKRMQSLSGKIAAEAHFLLSGNMSLANDMIVLNNRAIHFDLNDMSFKNLFQISIQHISTSYKGCCKTLV